MVMIMHAVVDVLASRVVEQISGWAIGSPRFAWTDGIYHCSIVDSNFIEVYRR